MVGVIQPTGRQHVMLYLLVLTVGMVKYDNVILVIIVKVKQQTKQLAHLDPTPPTKDPLFASNAHPVPMPTRLVPCRVKIVTLLPTNPNPMRRNAFQCKKDTTNRVQRPKLNARRVKQDVVATKRVKIVTLGCTKTCPATPRALNAPVDLATKPKAPRHAMRCLLVRTV